MTHAAGGGSKSLRYPLCGDAQTSEEARSPAAQATAAAFVVLAIAIAFLPILPAVRAAAALVLLVGAATLARLAARRVRPARGWLGVDERGATRIEAGVARPLARWDEPFGMTVLASRDRGRARALIAFTTPANTRYVAVTIVDDDDDAAAQSLLSRAITVPESEIDEVLGEDYAALSGADAAHALATMDRHAPAATERLFLSGARGEPVVLDAGKLALGTGTIDLAAPLEWRGFMFHESAGRVAAFYQATWVRQADAEAVLVAPMPAETSAARDLRELRVVQSLPEEPPARELRIAIDRLFMLPLRHALDRAPRALRSAQPPRPSWPDTRA